MGLQEFFHGMFHNSERMAVGKNRPYFLRSVELVKSLKGLSHFGPSSQKGLQQLYTELENILRTAKDASGGKAKKGKDEHLDKMFDEAIRHVNAFLQKHGGAKQAQEFNDNMKKAWAGDSVAAGQMNVMEGRIFQMMERYKNMKKKTFNMFHWLQPDTPSIHTSDWFDKSLWSKYDVEDGITVEEFINRILTTMITEETLRFRDDLLLQNPRLYHRRIIEDNRFFNIKRQGELLQPDAMSKTLDKFSGDELSLAFDFGDGKESSLQDLINQIFETQSRNFPEWRDKWKNVYWTRCPADETFIWSGTGNSKKTCAYKDQEHGGHVIYRDPEGNMEHLLILAHQIRDKPLPADKKSQPNPATKEPLKEKLPPHEPTFAAPPNRDPKPSTNIPPGPALGRKDLVPNNPPPSDTKSQPATTTEEPVKGKSPAKKSNSVVPPNSGPKPPAYSPPELKIDTNPQVGAGRLAPRQSKTAPTRRWGLRSFLERFASTPNPDDDDD